MANMEIYKTANPKYFNSETGSLAGKRSGEVRRKKREIKDAAKTIMEMKLKSGELEDFDSVMSGIGKNTTGAEAIFLQQLLRAVEGDTKAAEFCFKYAGLEPAKEIEVNADVNHSNDEISNILNILTDYKENGGKYSPSADKKNGKEDEDDE